MNIDELWRCFCRAESNLERARIAGLISAIVDRDERPLSEPAARAVLNRMPQYSTGGRPAATRARRNRRRGSRRPLVAAV